MSFSILFLLSALIFFSFSIFIWFNISKKKQSMEFIFLLFSLSVGWWHLFSYLLQINQTGLIWLARLEYSGIIFVPVLLYHFILKITEYDKNKLFFSFLKLSYFLAFIFEILVFTNNNFINGINIYSWGKTASAGGLIHSSFIIFTSILATATLYTIYKKYKNSYIIEAKKQLFYLFLSILIFSLSIFDFLPKYGYNVHLWSFIPMLIFTSIIFYSILKYNLFPKIILIENILISLFLSIVSLISFKFYSFWKNNLLNNFNKDEILIFEFILIFIYIIILIKLHSFLKKKFYEYFKTFNFKLHFNNIISELKNIKNKNEKYTYLINKLEIILNTDSFIIRKKENQNLVLIDNKDISETEIKNNLKEIFETLKQEEGVKIIDREKNNIFIPSSFKSKTFNLLKRANVSASINLDKNSFLFIKEKNDKKEYSNEEFMLLKLLARKFGKNDV